MKSYPFSMRFFTFLLTLPLAVFFLQSCGEDDPFKIDYSEVPDPFVDIQQEADSTTEDGLRIYFVKSGNEILPAVTSNDQIRLRYTGRTADNGKIFESTWANGFDNPAVFRNLTPEPINTGNNSVGPLIDGFRRGLIGMHEGEKRTLVIPPELGYGDRDGHNLQNETLVFDIELLEIQ